MKTIAVLTSGGDAPGMNAAVRAVVRLAKEHEYRVIGIYRGYAGIFKEEMKELTPVDMSDVIERGGTVLYTGRCRTMTEADGPKRAAEILKAHGIEALVVIGGDGSLKGAESLAKQGVNVIGIPATIDLDLACTEYTLGFDTACNTAMEAIDKVRDTSASHERISIIEVMGRKCGLIALWSGIASGAEEILVPETYDYNDRALIDRILERVSHGKKQHIIVNAEGIGESEALAKRIENATGIESRATILGYMQRGGSPTTRDRLTASLMGEHAIRCIAEGLTNRIVVEQGHEITDVDITEGLAAQKPLPEALLRLATTLVRK